MPTASARELAPSLRRTRELWNFTVFSLMLQFLGNRLVPATRDEQLDHLELTGAKIPGRLCRVHRTGRSRGIAIAISVPQPGVASTVMRPESAWIRCLRSCI